MTDPVSVLSEIIGGDALGMGAAAKLLPAHRGGGRTCPSTPWRWITTGVRTTTGLNVRLEAARVGGRWLTSKAALMRFMAAITPSNALTANQTTSAPAPRTPAARRHASERANAKLEKMGA